MKLNQIQQPAPVGIVSITEHNAPPLDSFKFILASHVEKQNFRERQANLMAENLGTGQKRRYEGYAALPWARQGNFSMMVTDHSFSERTSWIGEPAPCVWHYPAGG